MADRKTPLGNQQLAEHAPEGLDDLSPIDVLSRQLRGEQEIKIGDAAHSRTEESLNNQAKRLRENREHLYGLIRNGVITVFSLVVLSILLNHLRLVITDPNSSSEAKQLAWGILGSIIGAAATYVFGGAKIPLTKKSDNNE